MDALRANSWLATQCAARVMATIAADAGGCEEISLYVAVPSSAQYVIYFHMSTCPHVRSITTPKIQYRSNHMQYRLDCEVISAMPTITLLPVP